MLILSKHAHMHCWLVIKFSSILTAHIGGKGQFSRSIHFGLSSSAMPSISCPEGQPQPGSHWRVHTKVALEQVAGHVLYYWHTCPISQEPAVGEWM